MIQSSEQFTAALEQDARTFTARFKLDGDVLNGSVRSLTVRKGSCGENEFALGSVFAPYIECTIDECPVALENQELLLQIGILINGDLESPEYDYIDIGYFTVSKPQTSSRRRIFTAYGRLSTCCGGLYESSLTFPVSVQSMISEISAQTGTTINVRAGLDLSGLVETKPVGLKYYEALQMLASLVGGFVTEDNAGNLVFALYPGTATLQIDPDSVTQDPAFYDQDYTLDGIKCIVTGEATGEEEEAVPEVSFLWGTGRYQYQNSYMTQSLFGKMVSGVGGYTYHPGSLAIAKGDPRLEAWDMIRYTDTEGNSYDIPCMALTISFDGGISCAVTAPGESTAENSANFSGPLTSLVERTMSELVIAKQILATKITADELKAESAILKNAVISHGTADEFSAARLHFNEAAGGTFTAEQIQALDLAFDTATGGSISLENLDAVTGQFETLIADSFTADQVSAASAMFQAAVMRQLYVDYLKAGYAVIDFANVNTASINTLLSRSAFFTNVIVHEDLTVTGELVGIQIRGDSVHGNTVFADALILRGSDGLYYQINADAGGLTREQLTDEKYQKQLDGSVLVAESVTARQINVQDLFSQNIIFTGAMHTAGKNSVDSTAPGMYVDGTGQFATGDAYNFIASWYDTQEQKWKVAIRADEITFGSGESVTEIITNAANAVQDMQDRMDSGEFKGEDATVLRIDSSRGNVFKNNQVSTVLTVAVYSGGDRITNITALRARYGTNAYLQWYWQRIDDSSFGVIVASDPKLSDDGFTLTLTPADVDTKVTFMCELIV